MTVIDRRLKEIISAVLYATEAHNPEEVLQRIADTSREVAHTKYAALGIPDGEGGLKYFKVSGMSDADIKRINHFPEGRGLLGMIMQERRVICLEDMQSHPRSVGFPAHHPHMNSLLGVPIQLGEQLFGMLYLCDKHDGTPFSESDILLIETLATYAALAIAAAEIREQSQRLALLEERERIGMALHDGIIQSLYGIGMQVELLSHEDQLSGGDLLPIIDFLNQVIEDIRGYIGDLRRDTERPVSIRACLQKLITRLHVPERIQVEIDAPDTPFPFLPSMIESLCLVLGEALSNAVRHSNATEIQIISRQTPDFLGIRIADNGDGFDPTAINGHSGLGLRNMQHRIRSHGGEIDIESAPGDGTTLSLRLPLTIR